MKMIELEDLKKWRAERIAEGNCDYDEAEALAYFIDTVDVWDIVTCEECMHCKELNGGEVPTGCGQLYCKVRGTLTDETRYCWEGEHRW